MSIQFAYRRLPEAEFRAIESDPEQATRFTLPVMPQLDPEAIKALRERIAQAGDRSAVMANLMAAQSDPSRISLDKLWHLIHFVLTGDKSLEPTHREGAPLHNVVMGGRPSRIEATYGPARVLSPPQVMASAAALEKLSIEQLRTRVSLTTLNQANLYGMPQPGGWSQDDLRVAFAILPKLVEFFREAANQGQVVVIWAS